MKGILPVAVLVGWSLSGAVRGDTDFMLKPVTDSKAERTAISARTFDTDHNAGYFAEVMPRGRVWHASDPDAAGGKRGWVWTNQYGFVGISHAWAVNYNQGRYLDGMNEKGLSVSWLEFDSVNGLFQQPTAGTSNLSVLSVVAWALGNFMTVDEVTSAITAMKVWQEPTDYFITFSNAWHLVVHDESNHTAVIEWSPTGPTVYGSLYTESMRAAAGDPIYAAQFATASLYTNLNYENHMKLPTRNDMVMPSDEYLPGDSWSASRFVRANRLVSTVTDSYTPMVMATVYPPNWRVQNADHILRRLEMMPGERRRYTDSLLDDPSYCTVLSLIRNHTKRILEFRGIYDPNLKKVQLDQLDYINHPASPPWMMLDPPPDEALTDPAFDLSGTLASVSANYYLYWGSQYLKMDVAVNVSGTPGDLTSGQMYIFCYKTNDQYYAWNGSGWSGISHLTNMPACYSGVLSNKLFSRVFDDYVTSKIYLGTKVYAGYGLSPLEMLMNQRCQLVHVVVDPYTSTYKEEEE